MRPGVFFNIVDIQKTVYLSLCATVRRLLLDETLGFRSRAVMSKVIWTVLVSCRTLCSLSVFWPLKHTTEAVLYILACFEESPIP